MKCKHIGRYLYDYINGSLNSSKRNKITSHLILCDSCRQSVEIFERTENIVKKNSSLSNIGIPTDILRKLNKVDLKMRKNETSTKRVSLRKYIPVLATVIFVFFVLTLPVSAINNILTDLKEFFSGDKGIESSLKNGFGQEIHLSDTKKDLTFSVEYMISDKNRTVIFFVIDIPEEIYGAYNKVQFHNIKISDGSSEDIFNDYSIEYFRDDVNKNVKGNITIENKNIELHKLNIGIESIVLSSYTDINIGSDLVSLNLDVEENLNIKNEIFDSIFIKKTMTDEVLGINLSVNYNPEQFQEKALMFFLINKTDDTKFPPISNDIRYGGSKSTLDIFMEFDITNLILSDYKLQLEYPEFIKNVEGGWMISIDVDNEIHNKSIKDISTDVEFELADNIFKIRRVILSPSAVTLNIESNTVNPNDVIKEIYLETKNGDILKTINFGNNIETTELNTKNAKVRTSEYQFEPTYNYGEMYVIINNYKLLICNTEDYDSYDTDHQQE